MNLDQVRLKELLHYDQDTGVFRWKVNRKGGVRAGWIAGCVDVTTGYRKICVDGRHYYAHRLAFLYMTGEFPTSDQTDHKNRKRDDNWWTNIREASWEINSQNRDGNSENNVTGLMGVRLNMRSKRNPFVAQITVDCKNRHLGCFGSAAEAHEAYLKAKRLLHEGCTI